MDISELWNKHQGETIYILGTGPSVRCYPDLKRIFYNQTVIGLNEAYKHYLCTYNITIHPNLIPDKYPGASPGIAKWIIKPKSKYHYVETEDVMFYIFQNNTDVYDFSYITKVKGRLYVGRGIQTGAMVLAAQMGASLIVLIGCDFAQLGPDHHGHQTHIEFHGLDSQEVYQEYYHNSAIVRSKLRDIYKTEIVSLQPFLGLGHQDEDYRRLCCELDLPCLPPVKDKSTYQREKPDLFHNI